jgi:outer membrane protein assembly factor BamA
MRAALLATALGVLASVGTAHAQSSAPERAQELCVVGAHKTQRATVLQLLPRRTPALFSDAELSELERRLNNLGIFDSVQVRRTPGCVEVKVREKWTLIPSFQLTTGHSFEQSYIALGLTEYNFLGTANQLMVYGHREPRGWGFGTLYAEHSYRRHGWALAGELAYSVKGLRFQETGHERSWDVHSPSVSAWFTSPPVVSKYLNFQVGGTYALQFVNNVKGDYDPTAATKHAPTTFISLAWDHYQWHDVTPRGYRIGLWLATGWSAGGSAPKLRDSAELWLNGALPLWEHAALVARWGNSLRTRGDPNFNAGLGSTSGVRGLKDAYYQNWAQSLANLELRQGVQLAQRWVLQGVLFGDAALFEQLTSTGARGQSGAALGVGAGMRLIPTFLAALLLRVDVSRLLVPDELWFVQLGVSQYF